jgi:uncharacterized protein (DUF1810 family)
VTRPDDPYDLARFVSAQEGVHPTALAEIATGRKRSHWMWFIFPQLRGLGASSTAQFYGLASLAEAQAYLSHPILGARLRRATEAVLASPASSLASLFGSPDDLKFRSCMTLFDAAEPSGVFATALEKRCAGQRDDRTLERLT